MSSKGNVRLKYSIVRVGHRLCSASGGGYLSLAYHTDSRFRKHKTRPEQSNTEKGPKGVQV
jgi:hypothetical protein